MLANTPIVMKRTHQMGSYDYLFQPNGIKCFTDRSKAVLLLWIFYVFSVLCLLCLCACLFIYLYMYGLKLDLDYVFFSLFNIVFDIFVVAGDGAADSVHILFSLSFKVKPD